MREGKPKKQKNKRKETKKGSGHRPPQWLSNEVVVAMVTRLQETQPKNIFALIQCGVGHVCVFVRVRRAASGPDLCPFSNALLWRWLFHCTHLRDDTRWGGYMSNYSSSPDLCYWGYPPFLGFLRGLIWPSQQTTKPWPLSHCVVPNAQYWVGNQAGDLCLMLPDNC